MAERLSDILQGREANCLLPFLWMRDGHHDELPALVRQVYDSGARAFCVESRPHEQFCHQEWWDDGCGACRGPTLGHAGVDSG